MLTLVLLTIGLLVAFPVTAIGKQLRERLVEAPARWLNTLTPGRVAIYGALALSGLILFGLFEAEGLRLFAYMAPEAVVWFTVFDVALYVDVFLVGAALLASVRVRALRVMAAHLLGRVWRATAPLLLALAGLSGRARQPRVRHPRKPPPPANDADPDPATWARDARPPRRFAMASAA
ncbi:MAG: hypothetical protein GC145_17335 [Caulobacter sp.]|nr:hypothetical protein [Caulobacter sp.]